MTDTRKPNPTMRVAKAHAEERGIVTLSSGVRAKIRPVSAKLLDEIGSSVADPEVPKQFIEAKNREEYNPLDPRYQKAVRDADRERGMRVTEALIMFGIVLVDPVPPNEEWLPKLQYLAKRGVLDLGAFDFSDPMDCEFVFKTYIAVSTPDLMYVSMASGLTEAEVSQAVAGFPGSPARDADSTGGPKT